MKDSSLYRRMPIVEKFLTPIHSDHKCIRNVRTYRELLHGAHETAMECQMLFSQRSTDKKKKDCIAGESENVTGGSM